MISRIPQKFNAGAQYEAARPLLINGALLSPGDRLPDLPVRRVKQLYDARKVRPSAASSPVPEKAPVKGKGKK